MNLNGACPICDTGLNLKEDVLISEILSCPDCNSLLVVDSIEDHRLVLKQAPQLEEDWGQ